MTTPRGPIGSSPKSTIKQTAGSPRATFTSRGPSCGYEDSMLEYAYRTRDVVNAWEKAKSTYVAKAVVDRVGNDFYEAMQGLLPGIALAFGTVLVSAIIGAVIGGAAGAMAGGVGAAPGAVAGAALGAKIALWFLTFLGVAFLIEHIASNMGELGQKLNAGVEAAWDSCGEPHRVDFAARELAAAYAILFSLLLEAVIAFVAKVGMAKAIKRLSKSKIGKAMEAFLEKKAAKYSHLKAFANARGDYVYTADPKGRPVSAEGWLIRVEGKGKRIEAEQKKVAGKYKGYDAGHLIPNTYNGAGTANNLVPMHSTHNKSYVKNIENQIGRHLTEYGDGNVYVKVTVEYSAKSELPVAVRHRMFGRKKDGDLEDLGEVFTNLESIPSKPMGEILLPDGKKLKGKDFQSLDPTKGVSSGTPDQPN